MFEPRKLRGLTSLGGAAVIGVESPIWTEYVTSFDKMTYLCFPRWLAVAETGWNNVNKKGYSKFIKTAEFFCYILKGMGITPAPKEDWDILPQSRLKETVGFFSNTLSKSAVKQFFGKADK